MKKILFVDEHKVVNYAGGVERVICSFANEFVQRGYKIGIVCMDMDNGYPFFSLDEKVKFFNLCYDNRGQRTFGGMIWLWKKIMKEILRTICGAKMILGGHKIRDPKKEYYFNEFAIRLHHVIEKEKPDLMIGISADSAMIIQRAIRETSIPIIAMCHMDPTRIVHEYTEEQIEAWKNCRFVQVLMERFIAPLRDIGIKHVVRIPNAVAQFVNHEMCDLSITHHRIITVGRLDGAGKRQHLLIEAFAKIAKKYPEWTVHIYGNVANKRYKKSLDLLIQEQDLTQRVFFEGVTDDIIDVYRASDIFVFPSEYEGFGLALAEAMSVGLAVVGCKDCTAVSELLSEDCGELVAPTSHGMAEGLSRLIDSPEQRVYYGKRAHERAKEFSPELIWSEWESLIQQVI